MLVAAQDGLFALSEDQQTGHAKLSLFPGGGDLGEVFDLSEATDVTYVAAERGLYQIRGNHLIAVFPSDETSGEFYSVLATHSQLLVGSFRGMFKVEGRSLKRISGDDPGWVTEIAPDGENFLIGGHFGAFQLLNGSLKSLHTWKSTGEAYSFLRQSDRVLIGGQRGIFSRRGSNLAPLYPQDFAGQVRQIVTIGDRILVGVRDHLAQIMPEKAIVLPAENDQVLGEIYAIRKVQNRVLVGSTTGVYELLSTALGALKANFEPENLSTTDSSHLYWRVPFRCALAQKVILSSTHALDNPDYLRLDLTANSAGIGRWMVDIPPLPAGEYRVEVVASAVGESNARIGSLVESATGERTNFATAVGGGVAGLLVVVAAVSVWSASWRLQRWVRIRLHFKWIFATDDCDYESEIRSEGHLFQVSVTNHSEARSNVLYVEVPRASWPPPEELGAVIKGAIRKGATIRVEADTDAFRRPWVSSVIGDGWSDFEPRIGGQVCRVDRLEEANWIGTRTLVFHGLSCVSDGVNPELPMATAEIATIARIFGSWGAETKVSPPDAVRSSVRFALEQSDIVHVAAHASPFGLQLADGVFSSADLLAVSIRCRLMVLSVCDVGNISDPGAFLWEAVRRGINVVAATRPVDDAACRIFFEEFFSSATSSQTPRRHPIP